VILEGACDCHLHIYDPRFAYVADAVLQPPPARVEDYRELQTQLGLSRAVVVQPTSYGNDNRCTLDAVRRLGSSARGIVAVGPLTTDAELVEMDQQGARGVRFNLARGASVDLGFIESVATRIATLGWHLQLHAPSSFYADAFEFVERLPVPVVIDHLGRVPHPNALEDRGFDAICKLLRNRKVWVKLSGAYFDSAIGAPSYADSGELTRAYVETAADRLVWGTDWPHPSATGGERAIPDDQILLDRLREWTDEATIARLLVSNPAVLYRF
jgi:D-galactarolactone isomerase